MDYNLPPDEQNPYAPPQADLGPDPMMRPMGLGMYTGEPNPAARVSFDLIGEAWGLIKSRLGTWMLVMLVYVLVIVVVSVGLGMITQVGLIAMGAAPGNNPNNPPDAAQLVPLFGLQFIQNIAQIAVTSYFEAGLFLIALRQIRGEPIEVGQLFQGGRYWMPMFIATLLTTLATIGGFILCIIPGIYIAARLSLAPVITVGGGVSGIDAMKLSWRALGGKVFMAFVFAFVVGLISGIGVLLCGVGLLITAPFRYVCYALLFRDFFLAPKAAASPWAEPV